MPNEKEYVISRKEEWFTDGPFDTKEEAIAEGRNIYDGEAFYVGVKKPYHSFQSTINLVEALFELESESVYDECGSDAADNWPERRSNEAMSEAGEKIRAILLELYGEPTVYTVENSEEIPALEASNA